MEYIRINENGINIVFGITEDRRLKLLHFSKAEYNEADILKLGPEIRPDDLKVVYDIAEFYDLWFGVPDSEKRDTDAADN